LNESDRKRALVADVNALRGGWARRVEDRFAVGVLDLILKLPFKPILFAEGKIIDGFKFGPTERQWVEGERILAAGLIVTLIGWKGKDVFVSPWTKQADCRFCYQGKTSNAVDVLLAFLGDKE
jgi:hypothetical protein